MVVAATAVVRWEAVVAMVAVLRAVVRVIVARLAVVAFEAAAMAVAVHVSVLVQYLVPSVSVVDAAEAFDLHEALLTAKPSQSIVQPAG